MQNKEWKEVKGEEKVKKYRCGEGDWEKEQWMNGREMIGYEGEKMEKARKKDEKTVTGEEKVK